MKVQNVLWFASIREKLTKTFPHMQMTLTQGTGIKTTLLFQGVASTPSKALTKASISCLTS